MLEIYGSEGTLNYDLGSAIRGGKVGDDNLTKLAIPADRIAEWTVKRNFVNVINRSPREIPVSTRVSVARNC